MKTLPSVIYVVDSKQEQIAIKEANKLHIPVVAIVDTNCDPDGIDYIIPGNDDAIRAIRLITSRIADACIEGRRKYEESVQADTDKTSEDENAKGKEDSVTTEVEVVTEVVNEPAPSSESSDNA